MRSVSDLGMMVYGIRQRTGLSQRAMAARLGVSQRYLSELETGKPKVMNDQFFAVLDKLGIELSFREASRG
ncbi:helix-turn-helix domain-containing protein [Arthrobacter caoxuetaonis]|uniref:Helix-turn-helix domain-containing protein n=1 Tax=Arthrobacter caoxuetaonis TaxID=2886935 RepID=A0A9X1MHS9_9MICC|nr:helix-turn-helix domain-containing protein [Arthrobacter caoxuetaonis]MCC3299495.1 helix-turn-helix domain-containing protein [Arthrobacter caoxuetaonis]USQ59014.1 helix-turn-helix domain-containing protein [Arthrobacter caoxuetaonis]